MQVGIDWGSEQHEVAVLEDSGEPKERFAVKHSRKGLDKLIAELSHYGPASETWVAIERKEGRLVDRLLEAGHPVVMVKPDAIRQWRKSEAGSGAKSDRGDAEIIADYLRLCRHRLSPLEPFSDHTKALRAVTRTRKDLVKQRVAASNQLGATLDAFWPGAKTLFADLTSDIALAFLESYPTPSKASHLGEKRMAAFLKRNHYSGRSKPSELVAKLEAAPPGITAGLEPQARADALLAMVRVIRALNQSIKELERSNGALLSEHPDAEIFTSLPRSGKVNAAQILAEVGDCRQAYDGPEGLAALAGVTPVTRQSGKHRSVGFRWACNKNLRDAVCRWADNSRQASPWAQMIYQEARERGHDHPHAVRILARAWIRVIWRCWIDRVPYDPSRHGAARKLAEEALAA